MFANKLRQHTNLLEYLRLKAIRNLSTVHASKDNSTTVNTKDVAHFDHLSSNWWDTNSPVLPLQSLNTLRVPFIRDGLVATQQIPANKLKTPRVLEGFKILEVGCGGGFLTENLARLHANVVGIDASKDIIREAERHVCNHSSELIDRIEYRAETVEQHVKEHLNEYDAVIMSEVIEHVDNAPKFISAAIDTLKPGGSVFITIPNRTCLMYVSGIFLAENILNLVPQGTHDWNKFVTPLEMQRILESLNCSTILVNGFFYEFWRNTWRWIPSNDFSYAIQAVKRIEDDSNQERHVPGK